MRSLKLVAHWLLAAVFIAAGANHFYNPDFYVRIMPPYLPWHLELVYVSGVLEILLGVLLLITRFSVLAAWGLIALLIAVFPANIHMAVHPDLYPEIPRGLLYARLPFQGVFIAWTWWFTQKPARA